jgi:hypothetical protein
MRLNSGRLSAGSEERARRMRFMVLMTSMVAMSSGRSHRASLCPRVRLTAA